MEEAFCPRCNERFHPEFGCRCMRLQPDMKEILVPLAHVRKVRCEDAHLGAVSW